MQLREYQKQIVDQTRNEILNGNRRVLIACPTGAGKTHILSDIAKRSVDNDHTVLALMHRRQLVTQMRDRFQENELDPAIIMSGHKSSLNSKVQIGTCQTYSRRLKIDDLQFNPFFIDASVVMIDESHHALTKTYQKILKNYKDKIVIGVTATPILSSGIGMGEFFDAIVQPVGVNDLIKQDFLVPGVYYGPTKPDLSKLKTVMGDYEKKGLGDAMNKPRIIGDVVDNWLKLAGGLLTMVFAVNVKHSKALRDEFIRRGVTAEHLDAYSDDEEREDTLRRFRCGDTQVLVNVALYTEGTDIPEIECIVVARPTKSIGLHRQILGRGARPNPGKKEFVVLDHGGNVERLGYYEDDIEWGLEGKKNSFAKKVNRKKEKILLTCEFCSAIFSGRRCPQCGNEVEDYGRKIATITAELVKLNKTDKPVSPQKKREWFGMLEYYRSEKNYNRGWSAHKFKDKFGHWPKFRGNVKWVEPNKEFLNYITYQNIKWAKSRRSNGGYRPSENRSGREMVGNSVGVGN